MAMQSPCNASHTAEIARTGWRAPVAVLLLALVLRIGWGLLVPVVPISDAAAYDTFARHLADGNAYGWDGETRTAYWPVGTSFVYSVVYRMADPEVHGYFGAVALNIVMGLVVVGLGMMLAMRWFGRSAGLAAGVLLAVWPMHVQFTTVIASELLFTALCLAGIAAWPGLDGDMKRRSSRLVFTGVLIAAASYVRPTALLLPAVLAGADVLRSGSIREVLKSALPAGVRTAVVGGAMLVCIAPWTVRNYDAFGRVVLISTNGGANFWMGNNAETRGAYEPIPERPKGVNEAEFDTALGREAMAHVREAPGAFVARTIVKAVRLHERETIGIVWNRDGLARVVPARTIDMMKWGSQACWLAVLGLSLIGTGVLLLREDVWRSVVHPAVILWAYFTAVHAVIVYQDRYHFPATPMIAALAGIAVVWAAREMGRQTGMWTVEGTK